jgi:glycosyltransferase involved in cell wall biosynthesis
MIGACLESLVRQNFPRSAFEVIIVDNGSADRTVDVARSFEQSLNLRVLHRSGIRIAGLRNLGASSATGEFVAFLDADCVAPAHWLTQAVSLLRADRLSVIGAHYMVPPNSSWVAKAWYEDQHLLKDGAVSYLPGGDLLLSQNLFLKSGGFDETIDTNEDAEFCERISALGTPVLAFPRLAVVHLGTPQTLSVFYRKHRWHGNDVLRVFLRDIAHSRNRKAVFYALYVLACEIGVGVGLALAVWTGDNRLLLTSISFLAACPFLLAARTVARRRRWRLLAPLTLLFLVYGLARAVCLLGVRAHRTARAAHAQSSRPHFSEHPIEHPSRES